MRPEGGAEFAQWQRARRPGLLGVGVLRVTRPELVELVAERPGVEEITAADYAALLSVT